jgi:iron complex outermembrane receptor protein
VIHTPPKQQRSTAYQVGTVFKAQKITLDADAYHVRFQSGYSSTIDNVTTDPDYGDAIYYLAPSSVAKGIEFESTIVPVTGLNLYLNGTVGNAYYVGELNAGTIASPVYQKAPGSLWVQQTPTDTETEGLSYNRHGFDAGVFNKRIGNERVDNGQYHNQARVSPFSTFDGYFNYTIRNHSIFDQTKIRLSGTNLLDAHNIQTLTLANSPATVLISGTKLTDQFNATTALSGQDQPSIMAGRSFSVSVTFGFSPRER